uniref:Ribosome-recycling factor, chloroplastic n=1 Tax=Oryza barthii TaxID=65489 RepID=A0A0D3GSL4_9ORYZ
MPPLHAVSPAAAAAPPRALSSAARVPQRPESRQLWWWVLRAIGHPECLPVNEPSFYQWLCSSRIRIREHLRRGFDTVVTLVAWTIWKERNGRIFNQQQRTWVDIVKGMAAEATLWRQANQTIPALIFRREFVLRHATIEEIEAEKSVIEDQARERMEKAIETVQNNFNTVRTGRANPAMLDRIEVEYYGTPVNLKSIAQINTPDATSLLIQPYDKSSLKLIEKTIVAANLGVTPSNDGEVIRVTVPPLTSDRRKELAKTVAKLAEEGKVAIRNIRRDAIKAYDKLEKEKKLSEDNVKDLSADLQKVTDEYMKKIEAIQKQKEQELMKI